MCLRSIFGLETIKRKHELDVIVTLLVDTHTETEKQPKPLLLTLRSVYSEGQVKATVRALEVGCIDSSEPHHKKVHCILYLPEDTHISQAVKIMLGIETSSLFVSALSFSSSFPVIFLSSFLHCLSLLISVCLAVCRMENFYGRT